MIRYFFKLVVMVCGFFIGFHPGSAISKPGPNQEEQAFAMAVLNRLQAPSFEQNIEYCGYIYREADGTLRATPAQRGDHSSCAIPQLKGQATLISSYHTHAGFNPNTISEVPSVQDLRTDFQESINGWVSTPGGRLWYVDHNKRHTIEICGVGCLDKDPRFIRGFDLTPQKRYTIPELEAFFRDH